LNGSRSPKAELKQIVDVIPQTIIVLTPDGKVTYANRATIEYTGFLWTKCELTGFNRVFFHPEDVKRLHEERSKSSHPYRSVRKRATNLGERRQVPLVSDPLQPATGMKSAKVIRWYATGTDIDDRKRAEDRMRNETVALREEIVHSSMFEEIRRFLRGAAQGIDGSFQSRSHGFHGSHPG